MADGIWEWVMLPLGYGIKGTTRVRMGRVARSLKLDLFLTGFMKYLPATLINFNLNWIRSEWSNPNKIKID